MHRSTPPAVRRPASDDPEDARFEELLEDLACGRITPEAEAELALYAEADPRRAEAVERARRAAALGRGWLERVVEDERLTQVERSGLVRAERGLGLALFAGGLLVQAFAPVAGAGMLAAGTVTLLWSFVRTALAARRRDPYRKVDR